MTLADERQVVGTDEVPEVEANIRRKGYYPLRVTPERLHELDLDAEMRAEHAFGR